MLGRFFVAIVPLLIVGFGGYQIYRQPDTPNTSSKPLAAVTPNIKLKEPIDWPSYGQSAYGVVDHGVLAVSNDNSKPVPMASLAKIITALAILQKKPLQPGEQGPMITLTDKDIANFEDYVSKSGTVVAIEDGEQISQYQAMQAMLMISANNMADTLAIWAFGSMDEYTKYANNMLKEYGVTDTTVADASGFSPSTMSTAHDLVALGILYIKQPLLKEIAKTSEADIPVQGKITSYNDDHNEGGIYGIKIGNTDEAGRCLIIADDRGQRGVSVVVILGSDTISIAAKDAKKVFESGNKSYDQTALD
jgi:serine-type D-Ala-D-Ala carboxypeptidase (penicillin-binding protein 5/6)